MVNCYHGHKYSHQTYTQKIKINYAELNPKVSKKVNKLIDNYKTKYADKIYGNNKVGKDIRHSKKALTTSLKVKNLKKEKKN